MRKGRHTAVFLLGVALVGLIVGAAISIALSSVSTDAAFFVIVGITVLLVVLASSLRAAGDDTDQKQDVRDIAAVPVPSFVESGAEKAVARLPGSESESEPE
jgi:membrane protein implicated in regulation of membrane protease activity